MQRDVIDIMQRLMDAAPEEGCTKHAIVEVLNKDTGRWQPCVFDDATPEQHQRLVNGEDYMAVGLKPTVYPCKHVAATTFARDYLKFVIGHMLGVMTDDGIKHYLDLTNFRITEIEPTGSVTVQ